MSRMLDLRTGPPVYLAGAVRTPIGRFGGSLLPLTAVDLGVHAIRASLARSGVPPEAVEELVFGHGRQAGAGPNPARQASVRAGIPVTTPAFTVNQACASGLKAILLAAQAIVLGTADVVVAGGMESMSNTPYLVPSARWGARLGHTRLVDGQYHDGFLCPLCGDLMGRTAERLAERYEISRREQDEYALRSQHRAQEAREQGWFDAEIEPIEIPARRGDSHRLAHDEHARDDVTLEALGKLAPVFKDDGTVHPGNSSGITDGAAALVVASESAVEKHGLVPQARILAATQAGVDPAIMGIGPVPAVRELLERTGLAVDDLDLVEVNEAFAAQVIAVERDLGLDATRLNALGGAIALGHPIGCTGARIVVTLLHALERRQEQRGLATLCVSGGMGTSLLVERVQP